MSSKVKDPAVYYQAHSGGRQRVQLVDACSRFRSRWRADYSGGFEPVRAPGFGTFDLLRDGLNYPQQYGASREIVDRIVRQRVGEPYLIGIELELERCESRESISDLLRRYLPDRHVCVSDGSLRGDSLEIVTSPLAPSEVGRVAWYSLLRGLARVGAVSHDSGRCGLHVSISRGYLRDDTWRGLRSFLTRKAAFFKAISRRDVGSPSNGFHFCQFSNRCTKYTALNLSKTAVSEFRFFRGTLKPGSFLASVEVVRSLVEWARGLQDRADQSGKRIKWDARGFVRELKRFPVASRYCADSLPVLLAAAPRQSSGVPRVRLTDFDRRVRACREIASRCWSGVDLSSDRAAQGVLSGSQGWRLPVSWGVGVVTLPVPTLTEYQIDWNRSVLPVAIREQVRRGNMPMVIGIHGDQVPDRPCVAVLQYVRGGWGNRSRYVVELRPTAPAVVSSNV